MVQFNVSEMRTQAESMNKFDSLLEAGAWLPVKTKADQETVETISARHYSHPALPNRKVVQIAAERTGIAEDRALDVFGFGLDSVSEALAIRRRRPMDFSGWALVTDPANAAYALNLVKRMKKAARRARSKPGHAWDAYVEMAIELDRGAYHFLPAFWEEVGVTYRDIGNETYAGRSLAKAMEAERVHALPVDMNRRGDMVVDFALSGCLTIKAIGDYAKDLQTLTEPDQAYEMFADLAVRRTWGGLPPWSDLIAQLKRLGKATDVTADEAIYDFVKATIDAPAIERAAVSFWKQSKKAVAKLLDEQPELSRRLLDLRTGNEVATWGDNLKDELAWIELLDEWEVLQNVWDVKADSKLRSEHGPGGWVGRLLRGTVSHTNDKFWSFLENVTKELASGKAGELELTIPGSNYWRSTVNLDVVEYCLQNKIPVTTFGEQYTFNLDAWTKYAADGHARSVDPVLVSKDERYAKLLRNNVFAHAAKHDFQKQAFQHETMNGLFREWLDTNIASLDQGAVPDLVRRVEKIRKGTNGLTFAAHPEAFEKIKSLDLVVCLHRNLQFGVLDEYGWEPLETAYEELNTEKEPPVIATQYPWVVIRNSTKAIAIDYQGEVARHEFRLPQDHLVQSILYIPDQFAVSHRNSKSWRDLSYYWSNDPNRNYEEDLFHTQDGVALVQHGDGWMTGGGLVRAGQHPMASMKRLWFQNGRFWANRSIGEYEQAIHEIDPAGEKPARRGAPPFFTDDMPTGVRIQLDGSYLLPAPGGLSSSPLGMKDGMIGWVRWFDADKRTSTAKSIDGETVNAADSLLAGKMIQPETDNKWNVILSSGYYGVISLKDENDVDMSDSSEDFAAGQVATLNFPFLNFYKVRDSKASAMLREISLETCRELVEAAIEDALETRQRQKMATSKDAETWVGDQTEKSLDSVFENLAPRLKTGLTHLVRRAADTILDHREMETTHDPEVSRKAQAASETENQLRKFFGGGSRYGRLMNTVGDHQGASFSSHLDAIIQLVGGKYDEPKLPVCNLQWLWVLHDLPQKIWTAYWRKFSLKSDPEKIEWLAAGVHWTQHPFHLLPGKWRQYSFNNDRNYLVSEQPTYWKEGDSLYIRYDVKSYNSNSIVLEYTESDKFVEPNLKKEKLKTKELAPVWTAGQLEENLKVLSTNPWPLPSKEELIAQAEKMALSPAETIMLWIALMDCSATKNQKAAAFKELYGLKLGDFKQASANLNGLSKEARTKLIELPVHDGVQDFFAADRSVAWGKIEEQYNAVTAGRLKLDSDVLAAFDFVGNQSKSLFLEAAGNAEHPVWKNYTNKFEITGTYAYYKDLQFAGESPSLNSWFAKNQIGLALLVNYETPFGDPARDKITGILKTVREALQHPDTILEICHQRLHTTEEDKGRDIALEKLQAEVGPVSREKEGVRIAESKILIGGITEEKQFVVGCKPHAMKQNDFATVRNIGASAEDIYSSNSSHTDFILLESLFFGSLLKLADEIESENKSAAKQESNEAINQESLWPQNPLLSAPDVVKAIAKHAKLELVPAALYLQMLALPDPTTANIKKWNGWTTAQYKKEMKVLEQQDLVIEAKRSRAGRSYFLPGGWLPLKKPNLPIEIWKCKLYDWKKDREQEDHVYAPFGRIIPTSSLSALFEKAWLRIKNGETPKYEEVGKKK